jgi:DUF4097 and DUF4098 domain-containing protein YvlB
MYKSETTQKSKVRRNAGLVIVLALAAVTSFAASVGKTRNFTREPGAPPPIFAKGLAATVPLRLDLPQPMQSAEQFRWAGRVAQGKSIEIKNINGDISAEPASGDELEVTAGKSARRSDASQVEIKVVEHAGGVTICAVYPSDDAGSPNVCEPGQGKGRMNVRNNDVKVAFKVRVPAGVTLVGRTVNGDINALELSSNVQSHTVNGSINISTSGYAQGATVNGDITARLRDANWPGSIDFKTVNGAITLDLPAATNSKVEANTVSGDISSDFPLTMLESTSRKHLSGTIGAGGRELSLKTVNGSIHLKRIG